MIRLLLSVVLLALLYAILHSLVKDMFTQRRRPDRKLEPEELVQDPCCQTYIPKQIAVRKKVAGREYYFCSKDCVRKFVDEKKAQN
jgi:YHS domain-containing protein